MGLYVLGCCPIEDSIHAYLNGLLLKRGTDYELYTPAEYQAAAGVADSRKVMGIRGEASFRFSSGSNAIVENTHIIEPFAPRTLPGLLGEYRLEVTSSTGSYTNVPRGYVDRFRHVYFPGTQVGTHFNVAKQPGKYAVSYYRYRSLTTGAITGELSDVRHDLNAEQDYTVPIPAGSYLSIITVTIYYPPAGNERTEYRWELQGAPGGVTPIPAPQDLDGCRSYVSVDPAVEEQVNDRVEFRYACKPGL